MVWDERGTGWDRIGRVGTGWDGLEGDGKGWYGKGLDGTGSNEMKRDATRRDWME